MGRRFFPLDRSLRLRVDQWSEGAAQVATLQGLQAPSFALAAKAYHQAIGEEMSADSLRRVSEGFGAELAAVRADEVEQAHAVGAVGERPDTQRVTPIDPIVDRASVSSDGLMLLLRGEGWKEVKVTAISQVAVRDASQRPAGESRRGTDSWVHLQHTSYQAGVWDADTLQRYQYAEGLRRGLLQCPILSSPNDAAGWIGRTTVANFPRAILIVDWIHADQRVWAVGNDVFGEGSASARQWVVPQLDALWDGKALEVVATITALQSSSDLVRQAKSYFKNNHERMDYPTYRAAGYPIGSGAVEGANRYAQRAYSARSRTLISPAGSVKRSRLGGSSTPWFQAMPLADRQSARALGDLDRPQLSATARPGRVAACGRTP